MKCWNVLNVYLEKTTEKKQTGSGEMFLINAAAGNKNLPASARVVFLYEQN
jgi:hypothetical protein